MILAALAATVSESLAIETSALVDLVSLSTLWRLFTVLFIASLLVFGTDLATSRATRRGLDPDRTLGTVRLAIRAGVLVWLTVVLARTLLSVAPLITACAAGLTVAVATVSVLRRLPGVFAGVSLALRGRLREGDRVDTGRQSGRIERLGPFECTLRQDDGALMVMATHRLASGPQLVITPADAPVPIELVLPPSLDLEVLRRRALISPYRAPDTAVSVSRRDDGRTVLRVFVWRGAERAAEQALSHHTNR